MSKALDEMKKDEVSRIANLKRQFDNVAMIFRANITDNVWELQNDVLDFLACGRDENCAANTGFLTSVAKGYDLTSLEKNGYPSKRFGFVVTGLAVGPASLPYKPYGSAGTAASGYSSANSSTATTVSPTGIQQRDVRDISEDLWRNATRGARLLFIQKNGCERELGLVSDYPPAEGIADSKIGGSVGIPAAGYRESFRHDALVLPRSVEDNADQAKIRMVFKPTNTGTGSVGDKTIAIATPFDPSQAAPGAVTELRVIHCKLTLDGYYIDENGDPVDDTEAAISTQAA